jgi:S-adenosylmethionine-diacylgycerolhomoserine-N-methlytransferase
MTPADGHPLERYYRLHARIYDITRWLFLFGRETLIRRLAESGHRPRRILEIGCGTGKNLMALKCHFPQAAITGIDLSPEMLVEAKRAIGASVNLRNGSYCAPLSPDRPFDMILCAYTLSMINPGWHEVIGHAKQDLAPGGLLGVVDFAGSPVAPFRRWMWFNHVRMENHLPPILAGSVETEHLEFREAYGGLWRYFLFIGRQRPD